MKVIYLFVLAMVTGSSAFAVVYVNPYVRNDGTYVQPHVRTEPNNTRLDNYSTTGNYNPYTGNTGNKDPYRPKY